MRPCARPRDTHHIFEDGLPDVEFLSNYSLTRAFLYRFNDKVPRRPKQLFFLYLQHGKLKKILRAHFLTNPEKRLKVTLRQLFQIEIRHLKLVKKMPQNQQKTSLKASSVFVSGIHH